MLVEPDDVADLALELRIGGELERLPEALRDRVLELSLTKPPTQFGATHWSSRSTIRARSTSRAGAPLLRVRRCSFRRSSFNTTTVRT